MARGRSIAIPSPSLVVMIGVAGSGKTSFCRRNFLPTQIVSSDSCRAMLADDPADQTVSASAFSLARWIAEERLRRNLLTVFDATSVQPRERQYLLEIARRHHLPAVAVVLDLPLRDCVRHDLGRPDRGVGRAVIARQARRLRAGLIRLGAEGFTVVHALRRPADAARARLIQVPPACDRTAEKGPFDIIGDVHGCAHELSLLLKHLGYRRATPGGAFRHPEGRRAVLLGDLVDRGPRVIAAARTVMRMVAAGAALCVPGNHDVSLVRCLQERKAPDGPGQRRSVREIEALPTSRRRLFAREFGEFVEGLPRHLVLDRGRLAVAHAGLKTEHVGRDSEEVGRFAVHGETTGAVDRYGLPVRVKWATAYAGRALVVYGHTPVPEPEWIGNTVNIDTGCVYGGSLTALRYPEMTILGVPARRVYYESSRKALRLRGVGIRAETRAEPVLQG